MVLLAMDFDGVIVNSIFECAVAAYNGYEDYCGNDVRIKMPEEIVADKLDKFQIMRPYIRSGEDYIYLFQAIDEGIVINSQKDFNEFQISYSNRKEIYYQLFYSARQSLMLNNYDNWIALNPLYTGMEEFLKSMQNKIHIISTKSSKYIIEILTSNHIELSPNMVHEAGKVSSKNDIIIRLIQEKNLSIENIIFIDDHFETLNKVKTTGVRCILAGWGYNTYKQRKSCYNLNMEMVDLPQFYQEFKEL